MRRVKTIVEFVCDGCGAEARVPRHACGDTRLADGWSREGGDFCPGCVKHPESRFVPADEDGLTPSQTVDLAKSLIGGVEIALERAAGGFVATVNGKRWDPYVLLSELLVDLGGSDG